jgi:dienelactone hydrolase
MRDQGRNKFSVELDAGGTERVPGILQLPELDRPAPAVLLLHGFTSRKEDMASSIGRALLQHGVASLAIDLPMHGQRTGTARDLSMRDPLAVVETWRLALREATLAITYLETHDQIDRTRLAVAGYSLGAYLAVVLAANEPRLSAVALTAGGDLPSSLPFLPLIRTIVDPRRAARSLHGRPLMMMNGKRDQRITPAQATALFEAASEPKVQRWYDGGHWPPSSAINEVAAWLAIQLAERPSGPSSPPDEPADSSRARQPRIAPRLRSRTQQGPSR